MHACHSTITRGVLFFHGPVNISMHSTQESVRRHCNSKTALQVRMRRHLSRRLQTPRLNQRPGPPACPSPCRPRAGASSAAWPALQTSWRWAHRKTCSRITHHQAFTHTDAIYLAGARNLRRKMMSGCILLSNAYMQLHMILRHCMKAHLYR